MDLKWILFDLDGTLLPMDQDKFLEAYLGSLAKYLSCRGYEPQKLVQSIWKGTEAMIKNDGSKSNEEVFWGVFSQIYNVDINEEIKILEKFYNTDFNKVQLACGYNPQSYKLVKALKEDGFKLVLATNPIFPAVATKNRIKWAGLDYNDFEYVTTYENSTFSKPNLEYYYEILRKLGIEPTQCLMVGNDVSEDMVASKLGMQTFLLEDCLINKNNIDISVFLHGSMDDLLKYIYKKNGEIQ